MSLSRQIKTALALGAASLSLSANALDWTQTENQADGQTVYFHAWGGSQEINRYLQWSAKELKQRYNVTFKHVKVTDIAETTSRLLSEKAAGRSQGGSVDLLWINGENFKTLKEAGLLHGPFATELPNWQQVDMSLPVSVDFSEPTDGLEAPWGVGQLVFIHDQEQLTNPPQNYQELLSYAKTHPGKISYPKPPEFHGTSFLKSLLIELTHNDTALTKPVTDAEFNRLTKPLWDYLDQLHPVAWREGKQFPAGTAQTLQLLDDGQLALAITFNPNAVFAAQANGVLAESTRAYAMQGGALTNVHYLAIPKNASAKAGALVAANFLMSPQAQSRKGDTEIWGDPSVLKPEVLSGDAAKQHRYKAVSEPHPSWQPAIEQAWLKRYGS